jgi:hypothetical protein
MVTNLASKTPIALFTYNRPHHARQALESLSRCKRFEECKLFIYCDGPKCPDQINNVNALQQVVQSFAEKLNADIIIQEKNIGLAHSIVSGVTDLCNKFGRVIVIEDDLVVSPSFIDYILQALDRYQDAENVYQISGFMYPLDHVEHTAAVFLPFTTTWGWATWDRAWKIFDWNATGYQKLFSDTNMRNRFNLDGSYPYYNMLIDRFSGKNDSWGILWGYAVFSVGGLVLHPGKTLVINNGFDGTGTHCGYSAERMESSKIIEFSTYTDDYVIEFPEHIAIDEQKFDHIKKHLRRNYWKIIQSMLRIVGIKVQHIVRDQWR